MRAHSTIRRSTIRVEVPRCATGPRSTSVQPREEPVFPENLCAGGFAGVMMNGGVWGIGAHARIACLLTAENRCRLPSSAATASLSSLSWINAWKAADSSSMSSRRA